MFTFPDPVDERAARIVAAGVTVLGVAAIVTRDPWLIVVLAYGFWARVLSGPHFSPLGQLATRVVAPRLPGPARLVPGPPKRFAQAVGVVFSTTALILWFGASLHTAALVVVGLLVAAASLEAVLGVCLGCKMFALLTRAGLLPASSCPECLDLSVRHPELSRTRP